MEVQDGEHANLLHRAASPHRRKGEFEPTQLRLIYGTDSCALFAVGERVSDIALPTYCIHDSIPRHQCVNFGGCYHFFPTLLRHHLTM